MCGRYTLHTQGAVLAQQFQLPDVPAIAPRYNIAPTQPVAVVQQADHGRTLLHMRWGLVPAWAQDPSIGSRMINARAETVAEKPAFRSAFRRRRCLVLADGFYEWQAAGKGRAKQPFYIRRQDEQPFAFAGLWEYWEGSDGALHTCTIITTEPNELLQPIHNRMPVILSPDAYAQWLDPAMQQEGPLQALLRTSPATALTAYPVSRAVNRVVNDSPDCLTATPAQSAHPAP